MRGRLHRGDTWRIQAPLKSEWYHTVHVQSNRVCPFVSGIWEEFRDPGRDFLLGASHQKALTSASPVVGLRLQPSSIILQTSGASKEALQVGMKLLENDGKVLAAPVVCSESLTTAAA